MNKLTITDIPLHNEKVLLRVDFNVPMKGTSITDASRIEASLPTIRFLLKEGASLIIMSHLGRPKGKPDPSFSLAPCASRLSELLKRPVIMASDCIGKKVEEQSQALKSGEILMLENLRFYEAEEKPESNPSFARQLANLGTVYVNDAFGTAHRKHSSTFTITQYFPKTSLAGFLMEKEISFLEKCLHPVRPFYAIIGGAKISTKLGLIENLLEKVDALFIGGAMVYTFLKAQGISVGHSLYEQDQLETAKRLLSLSKEKKIPIHMPSDIVIAKEFEDHAEQKTIPFYEDIPDPWQGMGIGPKTIEKWKTLLVNGKTIFWNGPVGVFELPSFAIQTNQLAKFLSTLSATTIVGGGDSLAAIHALHLDKAFSHLSTGGGASLEFLEFGHLPGIDALTDKDQ